MQRSGVTLGDRDIGLYRQLDMFRPQQQPVLYVIQPSKTNHEYKSMDIKLQWKLAEAPQMDMHHAMSVEDIEETLLARQCHMPAGLDRHGCLDLEM